MYPVEVMVVAVNSLFVTIQSSVVTLIAERDLNAWRLETKIGFIAVSFSVNTIKLRLCFQFVHHLPKML